MSIEAKVEQKNLSYAKKGIMWAVFGGVLCGFPPLFQTLGMRIEPLSSGTLLGILAVPFVMGCLQDLVAGFLVLIPNLKNGKGKEYVRALRTKPGRIILVASFFGGTMAIAGFMTGIYLAGPVYPVAVSASFPALGAILARIFLKEKISPRCWLGIFLCVAGAVVITWTEPAGEVYPMFYLGIFAGVVAGVGWALEGTISCAGMDFIDPEVALGIRNFASGIMFLMLLPFAAGFGFDVIKLLLATIPTMGFFYIALCALTQGFGFFFYYKANNACGAARGMSLNILYTLVAAILGVTFLGTQLTIFFVVGLVALMAGAIFVAGKPSELFSVRDVN